MYSSVANNTSLFTARREVQKIQMSDNANALVVIVNDSNELVRFQNTSHQAQNGVTLNPLELLENRLSDSTVELIILAHDFFG